MPTASVILVPGYNGSGPDHWQTHWQHRRTDCRRLEIAAWHDPDPDSATAALAALVATAPQPVVVVAHSLGCAMLVHCVERHAPNIAGALLVAPCDVERPELPACIARFAPLPMTGLPFRSIVIASSNDRYATLARARCFAQAWGSAFVNIGAAGHINADSGLGEWPFGEVLLDDLIATSASDRWPYERAAGLRQAPLPCLAPHDAPRASVARADLPARPRA
jgi:predicted alpha/beta hydrolase family esterase